MALNPLDLFSRPSPLDVHSAASARELMPGPQFEMLLQTTPDLRPAPAAAQHDRPKEQPEPAERAPSAADRADELPARPADAPSDANETDSTNPHDSVAADEVQGARAGDGTATVDEERKEEEEKEEAKADTSEPAVVMCVMMPPQAKAIAMEAKPIGAEGATESTEQGAAPVATAEDSNVQHLRVEIAPLEEQLAASVAEAVVPEVSAIAEASLDADRVIVDEVQTEIAAETRNTTATIAATIPGSENSPKIAADVEAVADEKPAEEHQEVSRSAQIGKTEEAALSDANSESSDDEPEQTSESADKSDTTIPAAAETTPSKEAPQDSVAAVESMESAGAAKADAPSNPVPPTMLADAAPRNNSAMRFSALGSIAGETGGNGPRAALEVDAGRFLHRVTKAFEAAQERGGEVRLRLSPPELGALRLEVRIQEGALIARLETETATAKSVLIENLPALRDRLAEQGLRIERFDIDLMQRPPGGPPDQPHDRPQAVHSPLVRAARPIAAAVATESSLFASPSPLGLTAEGLNVII